MSLDISRSKHVLALASSCIESVQVVLDLRDIQMNTAFGKINEVMYS